VLKLERIPLEILILLLEHRGEIVSREKIVARVWGNVCLAAELQETGRALRTICREFSRDALPWLLHYSAEAFVRWLLAIFAPCRKQTCSRSDIDVCDEQSFLSVRLTGKECAVGPHNR